MSQALISGRPGKELTSKERSEGKRAAEIVRRLKKEFPEATTELIHKNPFQLLVATILSAQSTDAQVNKILPALFKKYKNPKDFSGAELRELEKLVHASGYYRQKAKHIKASSEMICNKFSGKIPDSMESLLLLPGVGRKTANIVLSYGFGKTEGIAVDTHVFRITKRLGLSKAKSPEGVEKDLLRIIPRKDWDAVNGSFILHGRQTCTARKPNHKKCVLKDLCQSKGV
jgi:endonuclease-3